jgi:hypothetical protein
MNHLLRNRTLIAAARLLPLLTLTACVATGYGGGGIGYAGGYYEPAGYEVGGWGPGYRVGPPRAAVSGRGARGAPSIPHAARGGRRGTSTPAKR